MESLSEYNQLGDYEHEHRDAEHEHDEEPEQNTNRHYSPLMPNSNRFVLAFWLSISGNEC